MLRASAWIYEAWGFGYPKLSLRIEVDHPWPLSSSRQKSMDRQQDPGIKPYEPMRHGVYFGISLIRENRNSLTTPSCQKLACRGYGQVF